MQSLAAETHDVHAERSEDRSSALSGTASSNLASISNGRELTQDAQRMASHGWSGILIADRYRYESFNGVVIAEISVRSPRILFVYNTRKYSWDERVPNAFNAILKTTSTPVMQ